MKKALEDLINEDPIVDNPILLKKSEVDAKAQEIKDKRALPVKPGDKVSFKELQQWLKLLVTEEMKERVLLYIYRVFPVINRKIEDAKAPTNIDIISNGILGGLEGFNEDYLINFHGGGKYKVLVFDSSNKELQRNGYFYSVVEIPWQEYPPKLENKEVEWTNTTNRNYRLWAITQKIIDDTNMPVIEKKQESVQPVNDPTPILKMFMDYVSTRSKEDQDKIKTQIAGQDNIGKGFSEIILEKMKQDDPAKMVTMLVSMMTALKPTDSGMTTLLPIIQMMQDNNKLQMQMMMESNKTMLEAIKASVVKPESSGDEYEKLEKILNIAQRIKGGGAISQGETSTTDKLMDMGASILPSLFATISNIITVNAASKGVSGIQPVPVPQPQQTAEQPVPTNVVPINQPPALPAPVVVSDNEKTTLLRQFAPIILQNMSKEGWEFAEWVVEGMPNGQVIMAVLVKDGVENLTELIKSVPELWTPIENTYGIAHFTKWINEFVNYKEVIAELQKQEMETV